MIVETMWRVTQFAQIGYELLFNFISIPHFRFLGIIDERVRMHLDGAPDLINQP